MKKYLTSSEALKELNNSKLIKSETKDGFITICKKSKVSYEINVYTNGNSEPVTMRGNIKNVLKTFNDSKLNNGFYVE